MNSFNDKYYNKKYLEILSNELNNQIAVAQAIEKAKIEAEAISAANHEASMQRMGKRRRR